MATDNTHELIRAALLTLLAFVSSGCVRQTSSGVIDRGSNTYYVSVKTISLYGGSQESLRAAYKEATEYCLQQDKHMVSMEDMSEPATVNLTFKCINFNDTGAAQSTN